MFFAKADFLVYIVLFCPCFRFLNLDTFILHDVETALLLLIFAQKWRLKTQKFSTLSVLLENLQLWYGIIIPKQKIKGNWAFS